MQRLTLIFLFSFSLVVGLLMGRLNATTVIPGGNITTQTQWDVSGSPYQVQGDLSVVAGVELSIEPGTEVQFAPSDSLGSGIDPSKVEMTVYGQIILNSSIVSTIIMGPYSGESPLSWYGLIIGDGGQLEATSLTQLNGSLFLEDGSVFSTSIGNPSDSGRISINGNLSIAGSLLVDTTGLPALPTSPITLFDLADGQVVSGYFAGLPEGAILSSGPFEFTISYHGGDGNDVVLNGVPLPSSLIFLGSGLLGLVGWRRFRKH